MLTLCFRLYTTECNLVPTTIKYYFIISELNINADGLLLVIEPAEVHMFITKHTKWSAVQLVLYPPK